MSERSEKETTPPCISCDHCRRIKGVYLCAKSLNQIPNRIDPVTGKERDLTDDEQKEYSCEQIRNTSKCDYANIQLFSEYYACLEIAAYVRVAQITSFAAMFVIVVALIEMYRDNTYSLVLLLLCGLFAITFLVITAAVRPDCKEELTISKNEMPPLIERATKANIDALPASAHKVKKWFMRRELRTLLRDMNAK